MKIAGKNDNLHKNEETLVVKLFAKMTTSEKDDEVFEDIKISPPNSSNNLAAPSEPKSRNGSNIERGSSMISMDIQVGIKATWMFKTIRSTSQTVLGKKLLKISSKLKSNTAALSPSSIQETIVGKNAINPSKSTYFVWLFIISTAVFYNLVLNLPRICFSQLQEKYLPIFLLIDYAMDVIFILDFYIKSRTSYIHEGMLVDDPKELVMHYFKQPGQVFIDVFSTFPFDHIVRWTGLISQTSITYRFLPAMLRLNRCLKMPRLSEFVDRAETRTSYPNFFRVIVLVLYILLIVHTNGCVYFGLSRWIKYHYKDNDRWVYPPTGVGWEKNETITNELSRQYIYSLYWSTIILTTIGEAPSPTRNIEYVFQVFDFLTGVLIFATIVGNVGTMIANVNAQRTEFQSRVDSVKQYMNIRKVTPSLQLRVVKWFDYLWQHGKTVDEEAVLSLLPDKLRAEVAMSVHLESLQKVKLFQDTEPGFLVELVLKLKPQVFSPGDFVCRKGDIGREMYIIKEGELEVVSPDLKTRYCVLKAGSYLGELSILEIPGSKVGNKRSANVRCIGYCDLFCLSKDDLNEVLSEYPAANKTLEQKAQEILRKDGLLDEEYLKQQAAAKENTVDIEMIVKLQEMNTEVREQNGKLQHTINSMQAQIELFQKKLTSVEMKLKKE